MEEFVEVRKIRCELKTLYYMTVTNCFQREQIEIGEKIVFYIWPITR